MQLLSQGGSGSISFQGVSFVVDTFSVRSCFLTEYTRSANSSLLVPPCKPEVFGRGATPTSMAIDRVTVDETTLCHFQKASCECPIERMIASIQFLPQRTQEDGKGANSLVSGMINDDTRSLSDEQIMFTAGSSCTWSL